MQISKRESTGAQPECTKAQWMNPGGSQPGVISPALLNKIIVVSQSKVFVKKGTKMLPLLLIGSQDEELSCLQVEHQMDIFVSLLYLVLSLRLPSTWNV